jgi:hypothetical protein
LLVGNNAAGRRSRPKKNPPIKTPDHATVGVDIADAAESGHVGRKDVVVEPIAHLLDHRLGQIGGWSPIVDVDQHVITLKTKERVDLVEIFGISWVATEGVRYHKHAFRRLRQCETAAPVHLWRGLAQPREDLGSLQPSNAGFWRRIELRPRRPREAARRDALGPGYLNREQTATGVLGFRDHRIAFGTGGKWQTDGDGTTQCGLEIYCAGPAIERLRHRPSSSRRWNALVAGLVGSGKRKLIPQLGRNR